MDNVELFFERYEKDPDLQKKIEEALALYPGSLEIRESVAEHVLLPVAEEVGLSFSLKELRAYETRKKLRNMRPDEPFGEDEEIEDQASYWLLDRGWEWDDREIRKKEALIRDIAGY